MGKMLGNYGKMMGKSVEKIWKMVEAWWGTCGKHQAKLVDH